MEILLERDNEQFIFNKEFDSKFLSPVGQYVQWKIESSNWDDYNELHHVTSLIERLRNDPNVWFDTHSLVRDNAIIGVLLIVGGKIKSWESKYAIVDEDHSLLLKYFHIIDKGKGYGSFWLNSVIFPYCKERGYRRIYVNSSHEISFPFYSRLGSLITAYEQWSDNRRYKREGKAFLINV